jgi:DtxR family Mn-dependent transcriptional regulator
VELLPLARRGEGFCLSPSGLALATDVVRKHRLWELYLTRFLDLPTDHVHRDAEAMEHALGEEVVARLEELLGYPKIDPHGEPIPERRSA